MQLHGREVEIQVDDIKPFVNSRYIGFKILWSGTPGFGEYTIYKHADDDTWYGDDEFMEVPPEDRTFLKLLLDDFIKQIKVEEK